jgi:hypothetical protein
LRHLKIVSYLITALGIACVVAYVLFDLSPSVLLVGLMMIIAGAVKVTMIALWHTVAGFGAPVASDDAGSTLHSSDSRSHRKGRP